MVKRTLSKKLWIKTLVLQWWAAVQEPYEMRQACSCFIFWTSTMESFLFLAVLTTIKYQQEEGKVGTAVWLMWCSNDCKISSDFLSLHEISYGIYKQRKNIPINCPLCWIPKAIDLFNSTENINGRSLKILHTTPSRKSKIQLTSPFIVMKGFNLWS